MLKYASRICVALVMMALVLFLSASSYGESPALAKVIEAARKEGKIVTYGDYTYEEAKELQAAFNKRYPFIKFEHLTMGGTDVTNRVLLESRSGTTGADLIVTGGATMLPLVKAGYLRDIDWAGLGAQKNAIDTPWATTVATVTYVIGWNTKLVQKANAPKNWDDLLNPKWKGAIGVWVNPLPFADLVPAMGEAQVAAYITKLMKNDPVIIRGLSEVPARLASGEVSVAIMNDQAVRPIVEAGGPIAWVWPDPIPVARIDAAIPKLARNPNAAILYALWLSSPEGAASYEKIVWRGNVFSPGTPIAQKTKGKKYSFWPTNQAEGRASAMKKFVPLLTP